MMKNSFIRALASQRHLPLPLVFSEGQNIEELLKQICAFLNAEGGWIIVGINNKGECVGTRLGLADEMQSSVVANINPLPLVYVQTEDEEEKTIVLITVLKGSLPPYSYKGRYYVQVGDIVTQPTPDQTAMLLRDSRSVRTTWEADNCVMADEYCLDGNLMQQVFDAGTAIGRLRSSENGLLDILSELKLMSVMNVSNGAVALFAKDTRRLLPQCRIRIQLMLSGKAADNYDDTQIIEGNIFTCLESVINYFKDRLPFVSQFSSSKSQRDDMLIYPIEVIDEAVSNALIHRDYTDRMDEVTIFIYKDRLEITNSGEMPSDIMISRSKFKQHGSVLRNPLMAEIFYIAGKMEKTGRGLQLISGKMKELGVKLPEWKSENGKTCLTVFKTTSKITLPERAAKFLSAHRKMDGFTKRDYIKSFDKPISETSAKNDLKAMVDLGVIEQTGKGPSTSYIVK